MLSIKYEEYHNDWNRQTLSKTFDNLDQLSNWIFDQMQTEYSDKEYGKSHMYFPTGKNPNDPSRIEFHPTYSGAVYWIKFVSDSERGIIFSDGSFTGGKKHWTNDFKEWCLANHKRQYNPQFVFAEDKELNKDNSHTMTHKEENLINIAVLAGQMLKEGKIELSDKTGGFMGLTSSINELAEVFEEINADVDYNSSDRDYWEDIDNFAEPQLYAVFVSERKHNVNEYNVEIPLVARLKDANSRIEHGAHGQQIPITKIEH